jgi:hypothetical protein
MPKKTNDIERLQVRLPVALHKQLDRAAKGSQRSLNAEIVNRLMESFARQEKPITWEALRAVSSVMESSVTDLRADLERAGYLPSKPSIGGGSGDL